MNKNQSIEGALSQNRAEEQGNDLWEDFVIPPFYKKLDLLIAKKPRVIVGGRGCGKTMLLKYLSHNSQFSPNRSQIPSDTIYHIGIYWRVDTHFASMMTKRSLSDDTWINAFSHLASLLIGIEIFKSLNTIAKSSFEGLGQDDINKLDLAALRNFDPGMPTTAGDCERHLTDRLWQFQTWLNNVRKIPDPVFLPTSFIKVIISQIKEQFTVLENANYFVYLDEYENLLPEQQRIVNTWLKHSEMPLIFNLAMKRSSFNERQTIGNESLVAINDYRDFDLEKFYVDENAFDSFAAEILFLRLSKNGVRDLPIVPADLRDVDKLEFRNNTDYKTKLIACAQKMFPGFSQAQLAKDVFKDKPLKDRLKSQISAALSYRNSKISVSKFMKDKIPESVIIVPALLYRKRERPEDILSQLENQLKGLENHFTGKRGWTHNFFVGCLLLLYEPLNRICPIYSGFKTFCQMANGNIRYLLELCHRSIANADVINSNSIKILQKHQSAAAKQTSTSFLGEIRNFGRYGNRLHTFVLRLGGLFNHGHRRKTQSEPEPTHFSIVINTQPLSDEHQQFLAEAIKWSVIFEAPSTKDKSPLDSETTEYILNPIYAPYFKISYRKGRKLTISSQDFRNLIDGSVNDYERLLKNYISKWEVETSNGTQSLFSELNLAK